MTFTKKFLSLLLILLLVMGLTACTSCTSCSNELGHSTAGVTEVPESTEDVTEPAAEVAEQPTEAKEPQQTEVESEAEVEATDTTDPLTLTPEERAKGTRLFFPLGAKYTMPQIFNDHSNYIYRRHQGFEPGVSKFIKFSREQYFRFDGGDEDKEKAYEGKDIEYQDFPLFGVFNLKKDEVPEDTAEMQQFMGFPHIELLREDDDFVQYFGYGDYDLAPVDQLEEEDRTLYKDLLNSVPELRKGLYAFRPMEIEESIGGIKNWKFKSQYLDGTPADESIFKDKDVTLVSYMTTWCPHCIDEVPVFQNATDTFLKEKNGQILALYADLIPDESDDPSYAETKAKAEKLMADNNASFPAIENTYSVDNSLGKYVLGYPTNFFVDKDGNVLEVQVGAYDDLEAAFDRALALARGESPDALADADEEEAESDAQTPAEDETKEAETTQESRVFTNYKGWAPDRKLTEMDIPEILEDPELTLTEKERTENYDIYAVVGSKYKMPESYNDLAPYRRRHRGFDSTDQDLIRMSREYYFQPQGENANFEKYPLFASFVLRKSQVPEDEEALKNALGCPILRKTYEDANVVQYFAKGEYNPDGLNEREIEKYKAMYDDIREVEDSLYAFPALDLNNTVGKTKNWHFMTTNHAGDPVTEEIFKNADMTLVSYMTTWCPHCINELPVLEKVNQDKGDKFQVIYIVSDANSELSSEENLKQAQEVLDQLFADYPNAKARILYNNISIDNSLGKYIMNFPTNFFVDRLGNVVGDVIVGGLDEATLLNELQERFKITHTK